MTGVASTYASRESAIFWANGFSCGGRPANSGIPFGFPQEVVTRIAAARTPMGANTFRLVMRRFRLFVVIGVRCKGTPKGASGELAQSNACRTEVSRRKLSMMKTTALPLILASLILAGCATTGDTPEEPMVIEQAPQ